MITEQEAEAWLQGNITVKTRKVCHQGGQNMTAEQEFEKWWKEGTNSLLVGPECNYKRVFLAAFTLGRKSENEAIAKYVEGCRRSECDRNDNDQFYCIFGRDIAAIRKRIEEATE